MSLKVGMFHLHKWSGCWQIAGRPFGNNRYFDIKVSCDPKASPDAMSSMEIPEIQNLNSDEVETLKTMVGELQMLAHRAFEWFENTTINVNIPPQDPQKVDYQIFISVVSNRTGEKSHKLGFTIKKGVVTANYDIPDDDSVWSSNCFSILWKRWAYKWVSNCVSNLDGHFWINNRGATHDVEE